MKLEIRNNYDSDRAAALGKISRKNPVMGVLIGECTKWGKAVRGVAVGASVEDLLQHFSVTDFVDVR